MGHVNPQDPNALLSECRSALLSFRRIEETRGLSMAAPQARRLCEAFDKLDAWMLNNDTLPASWRGDHTVTQVVPGSIANPCPSPQAGGREDRCGRFSFPKRCSETECSAPDAESTFPAGPRESGVLNPVEEDVPAPDTHDCFTFALAVAREKETPGTAWLSRMLRSEADVRDALNLYGIHVIQLDNHSDPDVLFYDGEKSTLPEDWQ